MVSILLSTTPLGGVSQGTRRLCRGSSLRRWKQRVGISNTNAPLKRKGREQISLFFQRLKVTRSSHFLYTRRAAVLTAVCGSPALLGPPVKGRTSAVSKADVSLPRPPHPKIPFLAAGLRRQSAGSTAWKSKNSWRQTCRFEPGRQLLRFSPSRPR